MDCDPNTGGRHKKVFTPRSIEICGVRHKAYSSAAPTFYGKNEIGFLRVIAYNDRRFVCGAGAEQRIEFDGDFSLGTRRDYPVIPGNPAPSAGDELFDIQFGCADVLYGEGMAEVPVGASSKSIGWFGDLYDRRIACGRGGRSGFPGGGCDRVQDADPGGCRIFRWGLRFGPRRNWRLRIAAVGIVESGAAADRISNQRVDQRLEEPLHGFPSFVWSLATLSAEIYLRL